MKIKQFFPFLIIILFASSVLAQDIDIHIDQIRSEFQRINNANLTKKVIEWDNDIEGCNAPFMTGTVTYFYDKGKLVKILSEVGMDHGNWNREYYFKNGKLIFMYFNDKWGGALNPNYNSLILRLYVADDKIIKDIQTCSVEGMDPVSHEDMKEYIETAYQLKMATSSQEIRDVLSCGDD